MSGCVPNEIIADKILGAVIAEERYAERATVISRTKIWKIIWIALANADGRVSAYKNDRRRERP